MRFTELIKRANRAGLTVTVHTMASGDLTRVQRFGRDAGSILRYPDGSILCADPCRLDLARNMTVKEAADYLKLSVSDKQ